MQWDDLMNLARTLRTSAFVTLTLTALACGAGAESPSDGLPAQTGQYGVDGANADGGAAATGLESALAQAGFTVQAGSFEFMDMTACCQTSCSGNNPSSPYATFYVPPGPGQTAPNSKARADGMSAAYRLRKDEAIVYVGTTPPQASYFGFTPYLMERTDPSGAVRTPFASLSETLNNLVIGTDTGGPFERTTAVIAAADSTTTDRARAALLLSGVPASAINVVTFDPTKGHFGLDETSDTFGVLFRMAVVQDAAKRDAYIAHPPGSVFRITPSAADAGSTPLPSPAARAKASSPNEAPLRPAVNRLGDAIKAAYPGYDAQTVRVDEGVPDPDACINGTAVCAGDNRDTTYPGTPPRVLFKDDDDFYVVFGANHQVTGKTAYSNVSVYALEKLVGIKSVASNEYPGSAAKYVPSDAQVGKLYAWKIARKCNGEAFCMEIPKGACPTGIENGALGNITFRTYLEPSSKTAPDPATLVGDRVLVFKKKAVAP